MKRFLAMILMFSFPVTTAMAPRKPCRPPKHAKIPTVIGLSYQSARKVLVKAGWHPLRTRSSISDVEISYGNGRLFWRKGYVELEGCAGTGVEPCAFLFKDVFGNHLRVITEGEESPEEKYRARVKRLRFVCD